MTGVFHKRLTVWRASAKGVMQDSPIGALQHVSYLLAAIPAVREPGQPPLQLGCCSARPMVKPSLKAEFLKGRQIRRPQRWAKPYSSKDVIRLLEKGRYTMEQLQKMCRYLFSCDTCLKHTFHVPSSSLALEPSYS